MESFGSASKFSRGAWFARHCIRLQNYFYIVLFIFWNKSSSISILFTLKDKKNMIGSSAIKDKSTRKIVCGKLKVSLKPVLLVSAASWKFSNPSGRIMKTLSFSFALSCMLISRKVHVVRVFNEANTQYSPPFITFSEVLCTQETNLLPPTRSWPDNHLKKRSNDCRFLLTENFSSVFSDQIQCLFHQKMIQINSKLLHQKANEL